MAGSFKAPRDLSDLEKKIQSSDEVNISMYRINFTTSVLRHTGILLIFDGEVSFSIDVDKTKKAYEEPKKSIEQPGTMYLRDPPPKDSYNSVLELHTFDITNFKLKQLVLDLILELLAWDGDYHLFENNCRNAVQRAINSLRVRGHDGPQLQEAEAKIEETKVKDLGLIVGTAGAIIGGIAVAAVGIVKLLSRNQEQQEQSEIANLHHGEKS